MRVLHRRPGARLLAAASALVIATAVQAQETQPATEEPEEVVISGFRASLDAALNVKKESVAAVDAIVAEDIAKFPD